MPILYREFCVSHVIEIIFETHSNSEDSERDIADENYCERMDGVKKGLKNLGVEFTMEPTNIGTTTAAVMDDTCGNLIQIYQMNT